MNRISEERAQWMACHILPHEPALRTWLARRRMVQLEVDDIIQETYAVLAGLASVQQIQHPRSYMFSVAQSLILRHLRRMRIVSIEAIAEIDRLGLLSEEASPEEQVAHAQDLRRMGELIAALPHKCREAFVLRKVQGVSQREIAARMGISENTVEKHVGKALRLLMDAMGVSTRHEEGAGRLRGGGDGRANGKT